MNTRVRLTYEDYAALPDDGRRYELHEGELSVTPAPGLVHQGTLRNLVVMFHSHASARGLGEVFPAPVDCVLEDVTVVQPDIVFVETARRSIMSERGFEGAPTLVVEIVSPSTTGIDRRRKLQLYARYAVPYYWIVDPPAQTIEAYQLTQGVYQVADTLSGTARVALPPFPDLILDPREIWPEPLQARQ
jgi:Uma2 family endonuclease